MRFRSNIPERSQKWLRSIEAQAEAAVHRAMVQTGIQGEARARRMIEKDAYDTGDLLRSVTHQIQIMKDEAVLRVFAAAEHGIFVEKGRKPGRWPNLDAMTKWVGRKLREEGVNTKVNLTFDQLKALAKSSRGKQKDAYRTHLSMLYLVGRKIATKGVREKLIFKRLESEMLRYFRATLLKELRSIR